MGDLGSQGWLGHLPGATLGISRAGGQSHSPVLSAHREAGPRDQLREQPGTGEGADS